MIYILIKNGLIHSVWDNEKDADNQLQKTRDCGPYCITTNSDELAIEKIEGIIPENGKYY